ncbi:MAG: CBS domain-containing protein [Planctomycetota bacterium]|jgi:CBS domain-containing protein
MVSLEKIMSRDVVTVNQNAEIYDALRMMVDGNITGLPVLDDDGRLVGIVTEKDVMSRMLTTHNTQGNAADYMTTDVISFNVNDDLLDIISALAKNDFRRVPIVSEEKLVGIISRSDIITYLFSLEVKDRGNVATAVKGKVFA